MKAWISGRVSTDEQRESGAGIAAQLDACRDHAARQGWEIGGEFTDEGVSGATGLDRRPGLLDALASMRRGDVLLVAKRDRLGRDPIAVAMIEAAVHRKGGRVVSVAGEGTEGNSPTDILMRRLTDAFSEYERLVIGARTRAALQAKKRRGERVGQIPMGYALAEDGKQLLPDEGEQAVISLVLSLRSRGLTMQAITDELNARRVPTKRAGCRWHLQTVHRVIKRHQPTTD